MRMLDFFRSSAVRVALAFVLVTTLATTVVFALVYFRIGEAIVMTFLVGWLLRALPDRRGPRGIAAKRGDDLVQLAGVSVNQHLGPRLEASRDIRLRIADDLPETSPRVTVPCVA